MTNKRASKQRYPQPLPESGGHTSYQIDLDSAQDSANPRKRASKRGQPKTEQHIWFKHVFSPKSIGQEFYLSALNECDITFCAGPAGCGKTWIATYHALEKLLSRQVEKIIVTKPILESGGEKLGALPGEVADKVQPHFQSILDCFEDHIGPTMVKKLLDSGKIQFLPTAYCRGRDLKFAYILIDEAQNLTKKGMKLLLTRISEGSTMAINGDTDQIDLPNANDSGFVWALNALKGKNSKIGVAELHFGDIQRHPLIETILVNLR